MACSFIVHVTHLTRVDHPPRGMLARGLIGLALPNVVSEDGARGGVYNLPRVELSAARVQPQERHALPTRNSVREQLCSLHLCPRSSRQEKRARQEKSIRNEKRIWSISRKGIEHYCSASEVLVSCSRELGREVWEVIRGQQARGI